MLIFIFYPLPIQPKRVKSEAVIEAEETPAPKRRGRQAAKKDLVENNVVSEDPPLPSTVKKTRGRKAAEKVNDNENIVSTITRRTARVRRGAA